MVRLLCWPLSDNFNAFFYLRLQSLSGACYPGKTWVIEHVMEKTIGLQALPLQPSLLLWTHVLMLGSLLCHRHTSIFLSPEQRTLSSLRAFVFNLSDAHGGRDSILSP